MTWHCAEAHQAEECALGYESSVCKSSRDCDKSANCALGAPAEGTMDKSNLAHETRRCNESRGCAQGQACPLQQKHARSASTALHSILSVQVLSKASWTLVSCSIGDTVQGGCTLWPGIGLPTAEEARQEWRCGAKPPV